MDPSGTAALLLTTLISDHSIQLPEICISRNSQLNLIMHQKSLMI